LLLNKVESCEEAIKNMEEEISCQETHGQDLQTSGTQKQEERKLLQTLSRRCRMMAYRLDKLVDVV
jgi:hypothetical protein